MKTIRNFILVSSLLLLPVLTGCLIPEIIETRIHLSDTGNQARIVVTYYNISSGEAEQKDVRKDFEELISNYESDDYLLEKAESRLILTDRDLFIEDEKVHFRETGIIKDLNDIYSFWVSKGERIMILDDETDYDLLESNGQIFKTAENTLIVWPDSVKELHWKMKLNEDVPDFEKNRKLMVDWVKDFLQKKTDAG